MNRRMRIKQLEKENARLIRNQDTLQIAYERLMQTPPPQPKKIWRVMEHNGKISDCVIDVNTLQGMGRFEQNDRIVEIFKTPKGTMILCKHNPVTSQWTYFLPSDEEKEMYGNALLDSSKLPEL